MACDIDSINAEICDSGIDGLSQRQLLLVTVAAAMNLGTPLSFADANLESCEANLPGLSNRQLKEFIVSRACEVFD